MTNRRGLRPLRSCPKAIQSPELYYKEAYRRTLESERKLLMELDEQHKLHRAILDKIHLTQIAASGLSNSECLEWIQERLEK
jgi:hypothetical protein